ncbi:MAG: hypothetical protein A2Z44_03045 [Betaproteobacteria bacterium RBG_19FT_COMBO_58_11]|nr:MAG: hypothetical protein A2Z44_03045 [Betaproteobacteria bacterium RBG_19FT_COMBO_58_11]
MLFSSLAHAHTLRKKLRRLYWLRHIRGNQPNLPPQALTPTMSRHNVYRIVHLLNFLHHKQSISCSTPPLKQIRFVITPTLYLLELKLVAGKLYTDLIIGSPTRLRDNDARHRREKKGAGVIRAFFL